MNIKVLDCTLRDGGYVNNWMFPKSFTKDVVNSLANSSIDIVEIGYLVGPDSSRNVFGTVFSDITHAEEIINKTKKHKTEYALMLDVAQITIADIPKYNGGAIKNIRLVFYKHQVNDAKKYAEKIIENGFKLFLQPMVTIDYDDTQLADLIEKIGKDCTAISIVDSFGNLFNDDLYRLIDIIGVNTNSDVSIGFHSHNNAQLSIQLSINFIEYLSNRYPHRDLIIDSSLFGIGRGAGNLQTEVICNFLNKFYKTDKYDVINLIATSEEKIIPLGLNKSAWGFNPHHFITSYFGVHPNYARFAFKVNPAINIREFIDFISTIESFDKYKCTLDKTAKLYSNFSNGP